MPEETKFETEINNLKFKIVLGPQWVKAVPLLGNVPGEGIHVVPQSGSIWPETHVEFYSNRHSAGAAYPGTVTGGSLMATPSGAYTELTSGYEVRFVPVDHRVTQLTVSSVSGSVCVSSPVSGYVAYAKYPQMGDV